jgi:hypothetical protein
MHQIDPIIAAEEAKGNIELPTLEACMDSNLKEKLLLLCNKYRTVFSRTLRKEAAKVPPLKLEIDDKAWNKFSMENHPRPLSHPKQEVLRQHIDKMITSGVIETSTASRVSQVHLVPKPGTDPLAYRFCVDYRQLNGCLKTLGWTIPNIKQMFERLGNKKSKFFAVLDLTDEYHQMPLILESREYAAITTFRGIYQPQRVWMGLKTAAAYFQKTISEILKGLIYVAYEAYIDDIIIYGETEEEFLSNLE